jgi:methionyl-tRNA formyltransferase
MLQEAIHHRQVDDEVGPIPEFLENYSRVPFEGEETCNQLHAVPDPWPNAFLETPKGTLKVAWVPPNSAACPAGVFRQTGERVLLGFSNGALRLHMLRQGDRRSERPTEHLQWLKELEIPGSEG